MEPAFLAVFNVGEWCFSCRRSLQFYLFTHSVFNVFKVTSMVLERHRFLPRCNIILIHIYLI